MEYWVNSLQKNSFKRIPTSEHQTQIFLTFFMKHLFYRRIRKIKIHTKEWIHVLIWDMEDGGYKYIQLSFFKYSSKRCIECLKNCWTLNVVLNSWIGTCLVRNTDVEYDIGVRYGQHFLFIFSCFDNWGICE